MAADRVTGDDNAKFDPAKSGTRKPPVIPINSGPIKP